MRPTEVFIFLMLIYIVMATRCIIEEKSQEEPEIHVIHLEDENNDSSGEPEVISFHIPDKRKREVWDSKAKVFCRNDEDCDPGEICIAYLRCVKIVKKINSSESQIEQEKEI
ncbi:hypothetical protein HZH68_005080 [Vespula germanica]|uniref:Uncharacterized protein n=2 Tax=Vespula TaxID=7451 RepID=A0A834KF95_VESGE|nr:uncharacterized protein LOC127063366 [Vespula vulgaris]KAF7405711.1 hypothetical protein HZH68_005080 [Vespula germanica]